MRGYSDREISRLLSELKREFGSLQVAHVVHVARADGLTSVNAIAQQVGCARGTVRLALRKVGAKLAETDR